PFFFPMHISRFLRLFLSAVLPVAFALTVHAAPEWIWLPGEPSGGQSAFFRQSFELEAVPERARLALSCDNRAEVWINGKPAGKSSAWESPVRADVQSLLRPGRNVIAVKGTNEGGIAALVARISAGRRAPALAETG